ncbi:type II toxin-antitoxin system HicA family toxin [Tundrisphaera lichenicola]|uniref:type II toxin-antitoxin system HicA family toxin n=1 Tax=Tundrisphaera lichenicola TaxID=2029860 RepID=UPI003EB82E81
MPPIPVLSGQDVIKAFQSLGWRVVRRKGSHVMMAKAGQNATLSVPDHDEVGRGALRSLIRSADLTIDDFLAAL